MGYGDFETFRVLYEMKFELINETPLSIGSGGSAVGAVDNPVVKMGRRPYIPGSSLKGILRSEAERFARATLKQDMVCDIMNPNEELKRKEQTPESYKPCIICRIFGGPTIASHLTIFDAHPMDDNYRIQVRRRVAINRITGAQNPGKLFDVEMVDPGTKWLWVMWIENIDVIGGQETEAALLRSLLKRTAKYGIVVGGKKSVGLGLLKMKLLEATKLSIENGEYKRGDVTEDAAKLFEVGT